jgi:hypothetical protein
MFERLNTGGTQLSEQEVRNCLLLMSNKEFFKWIENLALYPTFISSTSLSDRAKEERYDMELVVRFLTLRTIEPPKLRGLADVGTFLTDRIIHLSESNINLDKEGDIFKNTFDILSASLLDDSFRRYDVAKERFMGGFLVSVFEVLGIGLGHNVNSWSSAKGDLDAIRGIAASLWQNPDFTGHQGSGVGGTTRILHTVPLGRRLFLR